MKLSISAAVLFFALSAFTHHDAITEFSEGVYLGEGQYVTKSGLQGTFSSFADIHNYDWDLAFVRDGKLTSYHLYFDFANEGFFDVESVDFNSGEETTNFGQGYCGNFQCYFSFALSDNRSIVETITFSPDDNRIYTLGSMNYIDDQGNEQTMTWQESLFLMNQGYERDDK